MFLIPKRCYGECPARLRRGSHGGAAHGRLRPCNGSLQVVSKYGTFLCPQLRKARRVFLPGAGGLTPERGCRQRQRLGYSLKGSRLAGGVGQKQCKGAGEITGILFLITEPAVVLSDRASLVMSNLRTKKREDSGGGYTNQTAGGPRE
jgi:hypothetical protein